MEQLGINPPGANPRIALGRNRRSSVRQKTHTPLYASFDGTATRRALDLSEVLNVSEAGIAIQASWPLEVNRDVDLSLDLSETGSVIHVSGRIVWSDRSGRVGIGFKNTSGTDLRRLQEWLFANALIACANYVADRLPLSPSQPASRQGSEPWASSRPGAAIPSRPDYTSVLVALAAVKREAESLGGDLDAALELVASRACVLSGASGTAIALSEGADMVCRATSGMDFPGRGARFRTGSGFSGECVRSGKLLRCEDTETSPLVDAEACRSLGIRSMIAVPVRWGESVIGLLEVFAPQPSAFGPNDDIVLRRLAEVVSTAVYRAGCPEPKEMAKSASIDDEFPAETPAAIGLPGLSMSGKMLFLAVAATLALVAFWLIGPWDSNTGKPLRVAQEQTVKPPAPATVTPSGAANSLGDLRNLAQQGDAASQFALGAHYATGDGVSQDYVEAVRWFSKAAEQGHIVAQATLGAYYWAGRGVPSDLQKAYFWSVLAQTGGDEASKYRVAVLASRMTRSQIVSAQQQADEWIRQHQRAGKNTTALVR